MHLTKRPKAVTVGGFVTIRAANTMAFYAEQQALPTEHELSNLHMRQQIFRVVAVDEKRARSPWTSRCEFDVPVDSTSDGSAEIGGKVYESKAAPVLDPVLGSGSRTSFSPRSSTGTTRLRRTTSTATSSRRRPCTGSCSSGRSTAGSAVSWTYFTGSRPVVTEEAKNLQIEGNRFVGSWNKGKGGNGYLRGSRVWDSVYAGTCCVGCGTSPSSGRRPATCSPATTPTAT